MGLDASLKAKTRPPLIEYEYQSLVDRDWEFYRLVQEITNFDGSSGTGEIEITAKQMQEIYSNIEECLMTTIRQVKVIPYCDSNNMNHERGILARVLYLRKLYNDIRLIATPPCCEWQYFYYFSW